MLAGHRTHLHAIEAAVHADGVAGAAGRQARVQQAEQLVVVERARHREPDIGIEEDHQREGRPLLVRHPADGPVHRGLEELAVEGHHLAVARVQRAETEVAVPVKLAEADVAVVGAVEERVDGRGLEDHMGLVLVVDRVPAQRLDVQGLHQPFVDAHLGAP